MSQDPNQFDLSSFSISSQEEKLAHQLNQTHLASTHSIFSVPSSSNQPRHVNNHNSTTNNSNTFLNTSAPSDSQDWTCHAQWDTSTASQQQQQPLQSQGDSGEGWGDGPPSYTSISQGTYFGFNSIMEASKDNGMPTVAADTTALSPAGQRAFGRFKNTPVTFTSAAAAFNPHHHHHDNTEK